MAEGVADARWLLLIHQLPRSPAYLRVKTARQLQKAGAVAVKNSVYVLPNTEPCQERFSWLAKEISAGGGEATLCESSFVGDTSSEAVCELFHAARRGDYEQLAAEARAALKALGRAANPSEAKRAAGEAALARLRRRLAAVVEIDFFGAPGSEAATSSITELARRLAPAADDSARDAPPRKVRGGVWVTRLGVHVDRIASAWLIRRFIDPEAKLKFVPAKGYQPHAGELRFDMFEAEYTHEGDRCTFEVLAQSIFSVLSSWSGATLSPRYSGESLEQLGRTHSVVGQLLQRSQCMLVVLCCVVPCAQAHCFVSRESRVLVGSLVIAPEPEVIRELVETSRSSSAALLERLSHATMEHAPPA